MNTQLRIELLGGLVVYRDGVEINRFRTHKAAALLAFLAYHHERSHRREVLIDLLWPDYELDAGRNSLSVSLSSLRSQFTSPGDPSAFLADRSSVRLNPAAFVIDVAEFRAALKKAATASSPVDQSAALSKSLNLYKGPLLPGFYEDWVLREQAALEQEYFSAAIKLVDRSTVAGDIDEAVTIAERGLAIDPLRVDLLIRLVTLYRTCGRDAAVAERLREADRLSVELSGLPLDLEPLHPPPTIGAHDIPHLRYGPPAPLDARSRSTQSTVTALVMEVHGPTDLLPLISRIAVENGGQVLTTEQAYEFAAVFHAAADAISAAMRCYGQIKKIDPNASLRMSLDTGDTHDAAWGSLVSHARVLLSSAHWGQIVCTAATSAVLARTMEPGIHAKDCGVYRIGNKPERVYSIGTDAGTDGSVIPIDFPPLRAERDATPALPPSATRFFGRMLELEEIGRLCLPPASTHVSPIIGGRGANSLPFGEGEGVGVGHDSSSAAEGHLVSGLILEDPARLITLTGPGGIGKTRLAVEAAGRLVDSYQGRVYFVPLIQCVDAAGIGRAVAVSLGADKENPGNLWDVLTSATETGPLLLVLDNFERLIDDGAALVREMLDRCPMMTCLATSQRLLRITGEIAYAVGTLPTPSMGAAVDEIHRSASAQLFVDRARDVRPDFALTPHNADAIAALCRRLEGIPLALELAAARINVLSPAAMLTQLADRFRLLRGGKRDRPDRHRTLDAAIAWSFELLPAGFPSGGGGGLRNSLPGGEGWGGVDLQQTATHLSIFPGTFDLDAAVAVCTVDPNIDLFEALWGLNQCSLLTIEQTADGARFGMLDTIRQFLNSRQDRSVDEALLGRHARHFFKLSADLETRLGSTQAERCLDRFEQEIDNFRLALDNPFGDDDWLSMQINLHNLWIMRGYATEGRRRMREALAGSSGASPLWRAFAQSAAGTLELATGDLTSACDMMRQSLAYMEQSGRQAARMGLLNNLGSVYSHLDDPVRAKQAFVDAHAIARQLSDDTSEALIVSNIARIEECLGEYASCRHHIESVLDPLRSGGNPYTLANALRVYGSVELHDGNRASACELFRESWKMRRAIGDRTCFSLSLHDFVELWIDEDPRVAATLLFGAETMRGRIPEPPYPRQHARCHELAARLEAELGSALCAELKLEAAGVKERQLIDIIESHIDTNSSTPAAAGGNPLPALPSREGDVDSGPKQLSKRR